LSQAIKQLPMTLSEHQRYAGKTRSELIDEIVRLTKEVREKNDEISVLKKKIALYKSIK
jgi:hypothetical protein